MRKQKELGIENEEGGTSLANLSRDMISYLGNSLNSLSNKILNFFFFFLAQVVYGFAVYHSKMTNSTVSIANTYINEMHNFHL